MASKRAYDTPDASWGRYTTLGLKEPTGGKSTATRRNASSVQTDGCLPATDCTDCDDLGADPETDIDAIGAVMDHARNEGTRRAP